MEHVVSRDLFAYWNGLGGADCLPDRAAVDPAAIRHVLAYTFILGHAGPAPAGARDLTFRLAGTRLGAIFGELRGRRFEAIWAEDTRAAVDGLIGSVLGGQPAVASTRCGPDIRRMIDLELLLLPLRHRARPEGRILGSLAGSAVPDWMGLVPAGGLDLVAVRTLANGPRCRVGTDRPWAEPGVRTRTLRSGRFRIFDGDRHDAALRGLPPMP